MPQPWEMNWGAAQAGDPVIAPPDPYKQASEQRAVADQQIQERTSALQNQLTELTIAEKQDKLAQEEKDKKAALDADQLAEYKLIKAIRELSSVGLDANDNGGWFETGTSGSFARSILPGANAGKDLAGDIKTLNANAAFDALQAMRDASKTGGALGAISERELGLLESSVANLDPNLSHESFLKNVEKARQAYLAQLARIDPQFATSLGYDGAKAEAALLELDAAYAKQFGQQRATVDRSPNPDARQSTPADIEAIMQKYGAN